MRLNPVSFGVGIPNKPCRETFEIANPKELETTEPPINRKKTNKFKPISEKKEISPGVTTDMLPASKVVSKKEDKFLFSYAAFIGEDKPKILIEDDLHREQEAGMDEFSANYKRRTKPAKVVRANAEDNQSKPSVHKRKKKEAEIAKTIVKSSRMNNSSEIVVGQLPRYMTAKIVQIENLYQEIDNLLKNLPQSLLIQLKQKFNIDMNKTDGLYFNEPNGDKLSVSKLINDNLKNSNLLGISFNSKDNSKKFFVIIDNFKKLVSNVSNDKTKIFESPLSYQSQNEVNSIAYQGIFQATVDKLIKNLSELKKSMIQTERKTRQNPKPKIIEKSLITEKTPVTDETPIIEKEGLKVDSEFPQNFVLTEHFVKRIESLWQELQSIEELAKSKNFQKRDSKILMTGKGVFGYNFIGADSLTMIDKKINENETYYRIIYKKDGEEDKIFVITDEGLLVKNHINGRISHSTKKTFITIDDDTEKIYKSLNTLYNKLKKYSQKYREEVEEKIKNKGIKRNMPADTNTKKVESVEIAEEKKIVDKTVTNLDNVTTKNVTNSGMISKFNNFVDKIKQKFEKILSKLK